MNYKITHRTTYDYATTVNHTINVANMTPVSSEHQRCHSSQLEVTPSPNVMTASVDYFGNKLNYFAVEREHTSLEIVAKSVVTVKPVNNSGDNNPVISCQDVLHEMQHSKDPEVLAAREFILPSPLINVSPELNKKIVDYVKPLFGNDDDFMTAVTRFNTKVFEDFVFDPNFSTLNTSLEEVINEKKGVCQDFTHFSIACLRALGFPIKYISGYIETLPPPGKKKLVGSDASHAWFSVYVPKKGWFDFDPTNNKRSGVQHIVTAVGRDYEDISPLKGMVFGAGKSKTGPKLTVSVDVARLSDLENNQ